MSNYTPSTPTPPRLISSTPNQNQTKLTLYLAKHVITLDTIYSW